MNFVIIFESFKFYKMKHEKTIQLWFILLYGLNIAIYFLPFCDLNFTAYFNSLQGMINSQTLNQSLLGTLTPGNWIFFGLSVLTKLICMFFGLMYATLFAGETESMRPRKALVRSLFAVPKLLLLLLVMIVPAIMSACLFFVPIVIFLAMMYLLPLNLTVDKQKLYQAMQQSYAATQNQRLFIFSETLILSLIISVPQSLILNLMADNQTAFALVSTFFTVLLTFMQARLMGILYMILIKKVKFVIPAKKSE